MAKKNLEINIKLKFKNMPLDEWEAIMKPYRRNILQFERSLRQLADSGVISYKILDDFTSKFKFAEIQRMRFSTPDEQEYAQPQVSPQPQQPVPQQASGFNFSQPPTQPPQAQPVNFGFGQTQPQTTPPAFGSQATSQRPESSFETSRPAFDQSQQKASTGFNSPSAQTPPGFGSPDENVPQSPAPSFAPQPTSVPQSPPSFGLSSDFGGSTQPPKQDSKISIGVDEEDRATGIAILRKKMLMELRKIRNVVEQEDSDNF